MPIKSPEEPSEKPSDKLSNEEKNTIEDALKKIREGAEYNKKFGGEVWKDPNFDPETGLSKE